MSTLRFNFTEREHCSFEVNKGMRIHFECVELNIAHMYFTNAAGEYIDVPKDSVTVYKYFTDTDKVIINVTDPLLEQMRNTKTRMGYLYSYYLLNKNEEYEICNKYSQGYKKYNDAGDLFFTSLRLIPHSCWKMANHQLIDFKVHS
jgi:hypothetical protein